MNKKQRKAFERPCYETDALLDPRFVWDTVVTGGGHKVLVRAILTFNIFVDQVLPEWMCSISIRTQPDPAFTMKPDMWGDELTKLAGHVAQTMLTGVGGGTWTRSMGKTTMIWTLVASEIEIKWMKKLHPKVPIFKEKKARKRV